MTHWVERSRTFFLGIIFCIIVFELGVRLFGFSFLVSQSYRNGVSLSKKHTYRILCLGDSVTAVDAVGGIHSYPAQLEKLLIESLHGIQVTVINKGVISASSTTVLSALEDDIKKYRPDLVVTMIGINDYNLRYYDGIRPRHPLMFKYCKLYKMLAVLWTKMVIKVREARELAETSNMQFDEKKLMAASIGAQGFVGATERQLWSLLKEHSDSDKIYSELCRLYAFYYNKFHEAQYFLDKVFRINPRNDMAFVLRGYLQLHQGRLFEAEESIKKALSINIRNDLAYVVLGEVYKIKGSKEKAEECCHAALSMNDKNDMAYALLGWLYRDEGPRKSQIAEAFFKKAISINPNNDFAHAYLGYIYVKDKGFKDAEDELLAAIQINPYNDRACVWLGRLYQMFRMYPSAEMYYLKAIAVSPQSSTGYWNLAALYELMGKPLLAKEYFRKAEEKYCTPIMRDNYLKIEAILNRHNIRWVCMQYPMRRIQQFKEIFPEDSNIIFVENNKNFREAIEISNVTEFFLDMFAGNFGHCSKQGHRLIAENLAAILREKIFIE